MFYYSERLGAQTENKQKVERNAPAETYVSGSISLITLLGDLLNFYFVPVCIILDVRNAFRNVNCGLFSILFRSSENIPSHFYEVLKCPLSVILFFCLACGSMSLTKVKRVCQALTNPLGSSPPISDKQDKQGFVCPEWEMILPLFFSVLLP